MPAKHLFQIGFKNFVFYLDDMVKKLVDFNNNRNDYPDPDSFKKQILAYTAKK